MANLYVEIGRLPPVNIPLLFRVNGNADGALWQVQAFFHPQGRVEGFPQGFAAAFGITADELPSAVVGALGIASVYGYAVSWVTLPGDPLARRFSTLAHMATAPTRELAVPGTNIMQPQPATPQAMQAFVGRIQALAQAAAPAPAPAAAPAPLAAPVTALAPVPAPAVAPVPVPAPAPIPVSENQKAPESQAKAAAKAPRKRKAPAKVPAKAPAKAPAKSAG